ncbi:MAG: hypothetical protein AAGC60_20410 [Acidobacteriota bacterium]
MSLLDARTLDADTLLAGAGARHRVAVPRELLASGSETGDGQAPDEASVVLRPLTLRDVQRIDRAAREQGALASVLMVQQALVEPTLTVEQVADLPAGLARFLLDAVHRISGLELSRDELDEAVKAPLARACFVLAREFGWTPTECSELTVGQVLLYLEMLGGGDGAADALAGAAADSSSGASVHELFGAAG